MRRLANSSQNLFHINNNIYYIMALALICVGNDIILNCLAFQANSLGQSTGSATPIPPSMLPSAINEKDISRHWEGRPSRLFWPRCVCSLSDRFWCIRGGWFPGRAMWMGRTNLSYSVASVSATTLLFSNLPTFNLLPSLPAPLLLNYNNSNNNLIYPVLKRPE